MSADKPRISDDEARDLLRSTSAREWNCRTSDSLVYDILASLIDARAEAATARQERDEARDWVRRLTATDRVLTCVYCGHAYPPGTPSHGSPVLTAHIAVCEKHPLRSLIVASSVLLGAMAMHAPDPIPPALEAATDDLAAALESIVGTK